MASARVVDENSTKREIDAERHLRRLTAEVSTSVGHR